MCKTNLTKNRHTYGCGRTCTNVYGRVRTMFWAIFDRTDMRIIQLGPRKSLKLTGLSRSPQAKLLRTGAVLMRGSHHFPRSHARNATVLFCSIHQNCGASTYVGRFFFPEKNTSESCSFVKSIKFFL